MHSLPSRRQHNPHAWTRPVYGRMPQMVTSSVDTPKLPPSGILHPYQVVGSILYYVLSVDCTLLVALGDLSAVQTK